MKHLIRRRDLVGLGLGALGGLGVARLIGRRNPTQAFTSARDAHARGAPFRVFTADEAETIEALGETLLPGAAAAGIAHFVDQQLAVPPEESLLQARSVNVKPPYASFYRAAIAAIEGASSTRGGGRRLASLAPTEQHELVDLMRQNKLDGWKGPPAPLVYLIARSDAVDVVYGTVEGYASLGVPYMAHIMPDRRW